jgi:Tfp pilus assembly protein PilV
MSADRQRGSSYIEVLIASTFLGISLLFMCSMFVMGFSRVTVAGKTTMGVSATRQLLEDLQLVPFDNLANLNGFNTDNAGTQPASGVEREVARRWRYALAGSGVGWSFTAAETTKWTDLSAQGKPLAAVGQIAVINRSATLREIQVTVTVPKRPKAIRVSTLITKL